MKRTHIVAAIVFNTERDKVYITKRHETAHKGGLWEFPGGKLENGETPEQAISRELFEEIGIEVEQLEHVEHLEHDYEDKLLKFDFFSVSQFRHQPYGKEGQLGEWVSIEQLANYPFPEANLSILSKVIEGYL